MKNKWVWLAALLWFLPAASSGQHRLTVLSVLDGDTILLQDKRHVRLIGINAPEIAHPGKPNGPLIDEPYARQSKRLLTRLLSGKKVRLELDQEQIDRYGRTLAYVYLPDGTFINQSLVSQGLAFCLARRPNLRHQKEFKDAQQSAMKSEKGMWRGLHKGFQSTDYIGNKRSGRFHKTGCPYGDKTAMRNRVRFNSVWDAFWKGYAPCRRCTSNFFRLNTGAFQ